MNRYGVVRLIRNGDAEISGAIASGMMMASQRDDIIRRRAQRSLMRVDIGRGGVTSADYEERILDAKMRYSQSAQAPSTAQKIGRGILGVYGLMVMVIREYFNFDNARWRG